LFILKYILRPPENIKGKKMKEIINPYDLNENKCFGCSRNNPLGLKLRFMESEKYIHAVWTPGENYQGYPNILHGGIISALLDETGAWCISVKAGTAGVTTEICIKFHAPVYVNKGDITMRASITELTEKKARVHCELFNAQEKLCTEAFAEFFLYPVEIAKSRFRYPGKEAFYKNS
jgi:uncharacterized protein (TIGR00369 family)